MIAAAIYCRKSTEQKVSKDALSVTQQEEGARAFAVAKGWTVVDVFVDDKMSGAEFERSAGFMRLMHALTPKSPFSILIVRDSARLGREMSETGYAIKQLSQAGVEVIEYVQGKSLTPKNYLDKMMSAIQAGTDEAHREASSVAVHLAHTRKHHAGYVVGGRVFGYRNEHIGGTDAHGNFLKSHTARVIDPTEAAVVMRIFTLYSEGHGLKRIAMLLTREGAPRPKPFKCADGLRETTGWSPSTARSVLGRTTYRGEVIWNKTKKKNSWGKRQVTDRPPSEWQRTIVEKLRIVSEDLWRRVASRRQEVEGGTIRFKIRSYFWPSPDVRDPKLVGRDRHV